MRPTRCVWAAIRASTVDGSRLLPGRWRMIGSMTGPSARNTASSAAASAFLAIEV
jgi:hypothetical protein